MEFKSYLEDSKEYQEFGLKYATMLNDYFEFVKSTEKPSEGKESTGKGSSYKGRLIEVLINTSKTFNVDLDMNNYPEIMSYFEKLRNHPDYKEYNGNRRRFPNAAINHFELFIENNLFRNENFIGSNKNESSLEKIYKTDVLYSEVKEGKKNKYYVTKYERKASLKNRAIEIHGYKCAACKIDLENIYGKLAKGFIEIHHIKPLSSLEEEIVVNPETDLVPLCPNCHRMIHRKRNKIMSVQELQTIIEQTKIEQNTK